MKMLTSESIWAGGYKHHNARGMRLSSAVTLKCRAVPGTKET